MPPLEVWVDARFLFGQDEAKRGEWEKGVAFAACSIPGQVVTFHVLLESGAVFGRLPIHALRDARGGRAHPDTDEGVHPRMVQVWDCPSYHMVCTEYEALGGLMCRVAMSLAMLCEYLFTLDWHGSPQAEGAGDLGWKSGNILSRVEGSGLILCLPNNRVWPWYESAVAVPNASPPQYKIQPQTYTCEGV